MLSVKREKAEKQLPALLRAARSGEQVFIEEEGEAPVQLVPLPRPGRPRRPGRLRGKIQMADDFDEADQRIAALFEGGE